MAKKKKVERKKPASTEVISLPDPFSELEAMQRNMDELFSSFFGRYGRPAFGRGLLQMPIRVPLADLEDHGKKFVAVVEAPGLKKEDFIIDVDADSITIKAERKEEHSETRKAYARHERSYTQIYKQFTFPTPVHPEKASAKYENGVLKVDLPKDLSKIKSKKVKVE